MTESIEQHTDNVFVKRIFDRETGERLVCRLHPEETPAKTFHTTWWGQDGISYEEVMRQTVEALRREKELARHVLTIMESEEGARERQERMAPYSGQARAIFDEMARIEEPDMQNYKRMQMGEMTEEEYQALRREIDDELTKREPAFSAIMEQVEQMNQVFSGRNLWVKHYSRIEVPDTLAKEQVTKWVGRLLVTEMKQVELMLPEKYIPWKARLPRKWLEMA